LRIEDVEDDSVWEDEGVADADAVALELAVDVAEDEADAEAELVAEEEGVLVKVEVADAELDDEGYQSHCPTRTPCAS
jgi:hypothetical protein